MSVSANPPDHSSQIQAQPFSRPLASTDNPLTESPLLQVASQTLQRASSTSERPLADIKGSAPSGPIAKMAHKVTDFIKKHFVAGRPIESFSKGHIKEGFSFALHNVSAGKLGKLPEETQRSTPATIEKTMEAIAKSPQLEYSTKATQDPARAQMKEAQKAWGRKELPNETFTTELITRGKTKGSLGEPRTVNKWAMTGDGKNAKVGNATISPADIKRQQESVKIYGAEGKLDTNAAYSLLTKGAQSLDERRMAKFRVISSEVTVTHDSALNPLPKNQSCTIQLNNRSGPDLQYNAAMDTGDKGEFDHYVTDGKVNENYTTDHTLGFQMTLQAAKDSNCNVAVLSGVGQGGFLAGLDKEGKVDAHEKFADALINSALKSDYDGHYIFCQKDPKPGNANLREIVENKVKAKIEDLEAQGDVDGANKLKKFQFTNRAPLDVARMSKLTGMNPMLDNAGDPSGYPGQNWEEGNVLQDEMHALATTFSVAQFIPAGPLNDPALFNAHFTSVKFA